MYAPETKRDGRASNEIRQPREHSESIQPHSSSGARTLRHQFRAVDGTAVDGLGDAPLDGRVHPPLEDSAGHDAGCEGASLGRCLCGGGEGGEGEGEGEEDAGSQGHHDDWSCCELQS